MQEQSVVVLMRTQNVKTGYVGAKRGLQTWTGHVNRVRIIVKPACS